MPGVEIAAMCDVDESVLQARIKPLDAAKKPAAYTDFRKLLEDKTIHAVSIATPNHLHALQTIWACQAGKDVYVEKPCTHNMSEVRQIVAADRKHDRMVQQGSQSRSSPALRNAVAQMREGLLGEVYLTRGLYYKWRNTIEKTAVSEAPKGVNYDLWLGPAQKTAFTKNRFPYNWHWFWDFGNGDLGNQGIHEVDICRWGLGVRYPTKVSAVGGKSKNCIGNVFHGSKGYLAIDGYSKYTTFLGRERKAGPAEKKGGDHFGNFIAAVRSRKRADLTAEVEEGAISTALVHLANISYRLGRTLHFDEKTFTCKGDKEATAMFTRDYRAPFVAPKLV